MDTDMGPAPDVTPAVQAVHAQHGACMCAQRVLACVVITRACLSCARQLPDAEMDTSAGGTTQVTRLTPRSFQ